MFILAIERRWMRKKLKVSFPSKKINLIFNNSKKKLVDGEIIKIVGDTYTVKFVEDGSVDSLILGNLEWKKTEPLDFSTLKGGDTQDVEVPPFHLQNVVSNDDSSSSSGNMIVL